jgi:CHAD domain-containing protein
VQIALVRRELAELQDGRSRPGLERLGLRLEQERAALQDKVCWAAKRLEKSGTLAELAEACQELLAATREAGIQSAFVCERSFRRMQRQVEALFSCADSLDHPADWARHHVMRMAVKRLRYTMETFNPAFGGKFRPAINVAKQMQTLLGEIHDCDIWSEELSNFVEAEGRRTRQDSGRDRRKDNLTAGIEYLMADLCKRRQNLFSQAVTCWQRQASHILGADLLELAASRARAWEQVR